MVLSLIGTLYPFVDSMVSPLARRWIILILELLDDFFSMYSIPPLTKCYVREVVLIAKKSEVFFIFMTYKKGVKT